MSYAMAAPLQSAVFQALSGDAALAALVGGAVYDAMPPGPAPATYVTLGPEDSRDRSDCSGPGAVHRLVVSVITDSPGFHGAKQVAAAVSDALHGAALTLSRGALVDLTFYRARAKIESGGATRRIDLTFRARVDDTV